MGTESKAAVGFARGPSTAEMESVNNKDVSYGGNAGAHQSAVVTFVRAKRTFIYTLRTRQTAASLRSTCMEH